MAFPSTHPPRTVTSAPATATPQGHVRGRPPIATFSANPDAKGMVRGGGCWGSGAVGVCGGWPSCCPGPSKQGQHVSSGSAKETVCNSREDLSLCEIPLLMGW